MKIETAATETIEVLPYVQEVDKKVKKINSLINLIKEKKEELKNTDTDKYKDIHLKIKKMKTIYKQVRKETIDEVLKKYSNDFNMSLYLRLLSCESLFKIQYINDISKYPVNPKKIDKDIKKIQQGINKYVAKCDELARKISRNTYRLNQAEKAFDKYDELMLKIEEMSLERDKDESIFSRKDEVDTVMIESLKAQSKQILKEINKKFKISSKEDLKQHWEINNIYEKRITKFTESNKIKVANLLDKLNLLTDISKEIKDKNIVFKKEEMILKNLDLKPLRDSEVVKNK